MALNQQLHQTSSYPSVCCLRKLFVLYAIPDKTQIIFPIILTPKAAFASFSAIWVLKYPGKNQLPDLK